VELNPFIHSFIVKAVFARQRVLLKYKMEKKKFMHSYSSHETKITMSVNMSASIFKPLGQYSAKIVKFGEYITKISLSYKKSHESCDSFF